MTQDIITSGQTEDGGAYYSKLTVPAEINPQTRYRCSRGHEWESTPWQIISGYVLNVPISDGRSECIILCPCCVLEFAKAHLGTVEEVK